MRGSSGARRWSRLGAAFPALLLPLLLAPAAAAEPPAPRFCTPASCRPAPSSPLSLAAGFALAALACGLVARRRR